MQDETYATNATAAAGDDCPSGTRNRFFRGKRMKAEDFAKEQHYFVERRRHINRAVLGWGIVHGLLLDGARLPVRRRPGDDDGRRVYRPENQSQHDDESSSRPKPGAIGVGPGLSLDRHGREIVVTAKTGIGARNTFLVEKTASGCHVRPLDKLPGGSYLLSAHYAERQFGDSGLQDPCGCDGPGKNYVCETAVFSLRLIEDERCPCAEGECRRECTCGGTSACCAAGRGPHACLCEWVGNADVATDSPTLCEWRGYLIDPSGGVPLACVIVDVVDGRCGPEVVGWVTDDCGPRRLVKSNDLLYDLLRGCDLTRISWISWHRWHRSEEQMPWQTFAGLFHDDGSTDLAVQFSGPVLEQTLRRDVVEVEAVTTEQSTGWRVARRVPVIGLDLTPAPPPSGQAALPPGTTNQMRLQVRPEWIRDEIEHGRESWLSERNFRIEITIRGDLILDCHEQAVDANAVGLRPSPTGNGTPGGTFVSNFRVHFKKRDSSHDVA